MFASSDQYQVGFGNAFASEAIPGTLPIGQNSPQKGTLDNELPTLWSLGC